MWGVISLGWMGRLHARSYRALAERYRDLGGRGASRRRPRPRQVYDRFEGNQERSSATWEEGSLLLASHSLTHS